MQKTLLSLVWLLALVAARPAAAGSGPGNEAQPLSGQWKGPLKVPGGALTLVVTIVPLTNGTYYAALDAPQQRINRMPVEVETKGDELTLRIEQAGSSFKGKIVKNGAKLVGTWQQPGLTGPLTLDRVPTAARAVAAPNFRQTPPYRDTEVKFSNPGAKIKLSGTLSVPSGAGPFPAVALLSDLGPQDREADLQEYRMFGILADYLARRGVAVLRFDDRGVGKSGGDYKTATTADLVTDAQAALAFLRNRPLIAPQAVGLIGHGEGANVALLAATKPEAPAFVVSLAGYGQPGRAVLQRQQSEIMRLIGADPNQVRAAQSLFQRMVDVVRQTPDDAAARAKVTILLRSANTGMDATMARARAAQLTTPWSRYFFDFDPKRQLGKVQCPVLLLNGKADLQVSSRNVAWLQKGLRRAHKGVTAYRLSGVNHWFQPDPSQWPVVNGELQATFSPPALTKIRTWMTARVAKAMPPAAQPTPPAAPPLANAQTAADSAAQPPVTASAQETAPAAAAEPRAGARSSSSSAAGRKRSAVGRTGARRARS